MRSAARLRRARALIWFIVTLIILLALGTALLLTRQRGLLREEVIAHMDRETELLAEVITDDLRRNKYAAIGDYVSEYGKQHPEIASVRVIAPNNMVLASYARSRPAAYPERQVRPLVYDRGTSVSLEMVHDFAPVQAQLTRMVWQLGWAALVFVSIMGAVLWRVMRKTAFDPLEQALLDLSAVKERLELRVAERTADWMLSNKELKEEISERVTAEEALRTSEARYRLVIENINEIIYQVVIDDERDPFRARVEFVSGQVENIVGHPAKEFLQDPHRWLSIIHRDDLPLIAESARRLVAERAGGTRVYRVLHGGTGEHIWVEDKVVPRFDDRGRIIGYFGVARDITQRKKAEDAVREALGRAEEEKNKSAAIIAAIGDGISIQDRDFKVIYQNDVHKALIGNHIGEYCFQAYRREQDVCGGCPVARSFEDGQVHTVEHRNVVNGKAVHVEIKASPLRDASGEIIAGIETVRNITDRKRTEEDLRTAYETQRVINALLSIPVEAVPLDEVMERSLDSVLASPYYSFHSTGGILLMEEGSKDLRMAAQRGFHDQVRAACGHVAVGACLCGRAAQSQEIQFAADVDERHDIRFPGMPPHGHYCVPILLSGRTVGVLTLFLEQGHAHDEREEEFLRAIANALAGIIHRKRMEEEREKLIADLRLLLERVHASRQEWQETFDSIMDPIVIMDGSRMILKANRAFASLCGMRPQEVVASDFLELLYAGEQPPPDNPVSRCLREARLVNDEIIEPRSKRVYHTSVFPFSLSEKELPGAILVMKDMTDDREKEMRLIMSERLAALGQMASGIAHEINNPLAAIAGCVDGMSRRISRQQYEPELFKRYVQIIKDEISRSKNITTSMLSFVRKSSYEKKQVDLRDTIEKTLEIIGYQGRLRRMQVEKQLGPDLPLVYGSEGELRQVLLIVITNALDAMNDSGTLTVSAAADAQNVTVDIGDTGPGISPENLTRIFDPFFTTKAERGSTGLGLSIAQRIIAAQNGSITVLPGAPAGAVFRIALPRQTD